MWASTHCRPLLLRRHGSPWQNSCSVITPPMRKTLRKTSKRLQKDFKVDFKRDLFRCLSLSFIVFLSPVRGSALDKFSRCHMVWMDPNSSKTKERNCATSGCSEDIRFSSPARPSEYLASNFPLRCRVPTCFWMRWSSTMSSESLFTSQINSQINWNLLKSIEIDWNQLSFQLTFHFSLRFFQMFSIASPGAPWLGAAPSLGARRLRRWGPGSWGPQRARSTPRGEDRQKHSKNVPKRHQLK